MLMSDKARSWFSELRFCVKIRQIYLAAQVSSLNLVFNTLPLAAFITRLADNDKETASVKGKIQVIERKVDDLVTKGYVDNVIKALQGELLLNQLLSLFILFKLQYVFNGRWLVTVT